MKLLQDLVAGYGGAFGVHVWTSTLWLAIALLAAATLRPITARTRCTLLLLGVAKFAIPSAALAVLLERLGAQPPQPVVLPLTFLASPVALSGTAAAKALPWMDLLFALWFTVALVMFGRWCLIRRRLAMTAMRTADAPSAREVAALAAARRRVGVGHAIDLVRSPICEAPAVLRVIRPVIVLPGASLDDLDDAEIETLLAHECAHVRRGDNLVGVLEAAIWSLFWFHPLLWIAHQQLARAREQACDEVVAEGAERSTYLKALAKICRLAVVPRVHGVSCMASAKLKERIEHMMNYPALRSRALPHRSITVAAAAVFTLFTVGAALVSRPASATESKSGPYAFRIEVSKVGEKLNVRATITENATGSVVSSPTAHVPNRTFALTQQVDGVDFEIVATPDEKNMVNGTFVARQGSIELQRGAFTASIGEAKTPAAEYSGQPISMNLKDADLRNLLETFGKLTGLEMRVEEGIEGKVTTTWTNVPWDQAFDTLLKEHGLAYRIEKGVIYVRRSR